MKTKLVFALLASALAFQPAFAQETAENQKSVGEFKIHNPGELQKYIDAEKKKPSKPSGTTQLEGEYVFNIGKIIPGSAKALKTGVLKAGKKAADEKCAELGYKRSLAFFYAKEKADFVLTDAFCSNEAGPGRLARAVVMKERAARKERLHTQGKKIAKQFKNLTIKGYKKTDLAGEGSGPAAPAGTGAPAAPAESEGKQ